MERGEGEEPDPAEVPPGTRLVQAFKAFLTSRKGLLLLAQAILLSFWVCLYFQENVVIVDIGHLAIFTLGGTAKSFLQADNFMALSFIIFICYIASTAAPFMMVPLLTFLVALCFFVSYSLKLNEKFRGIYWLLGDFLCGIIAAIIYFAISIAAVSKYTDTASKAAGVFGFITTIIYCVYVYFTFNDLATYLKQEDPSDAPKSQKSEDDSDSDSD